MSAGLAEQHWTASFPAFEQARASRDPAWLQALRKSALARFAELGFPTRRDEAWKYTNPAPIGKTPFQPAGVDARAIGPAPDLSGLTLLPGDAPRLVFVNGVAASAASAPEARDPRLELESLARRLAADPGGLEPYLGRLASGAERPFVALNTAFHADGAFVRVPRGLELEEPLFLVFLTAPEAQPRAAHPRVLVLAEPESRVRVVELYAGLGAGRVLVNAVSEVFVGSNASVEHVRLQCEAPATYHLAALDVVQQRDARFRSHVLSFGAELARNEVNAVLDAEGAECVLNGLYVANGSQLTDHQTTIDHRRPHGTSRELYKGILAGSARGVFNGRVVVREDAQKSDARQQNDNLLLSAGADVNTKPQLEIRADDVRCSHGSTIGHLDDDALFYLRSRGLPARTARGILTRGFASEITREIAIGSLRERIDDLVVERLFGAEAGEEAA